MSSRKRLSEILSLRLEAIASFSKASSSPTTIRQALWTWSPMSSSRCAVSSNPQLSDPAEGQKWVGKGQEKSRMRLAWQNGDNLHK